MMSESLISPNAAASFDRRRHFWFSGLTPLVDFDAAAALLPSVCPAGASGAVPYDVTTGWQWYLPSYGRTHYNHMSGPNSREIDCSAQAVGGGMVQGFGIHSARSQHGNGVNALLSDGSVRHIAEVLDLKVWRDMSTLSGREVVGEF